MREFIYARVIRGVELQHTATRCNTGARHNLQHTATHCNALQRTATHCNTLQHTTTHCNTLQHTAPHCNTLHHTATHCNTLQHTATHCNTIHSSLTDGGFPRIRTQLLCLTQESCKSDGGPREWGGPGPRKRIRGTGA